MRTSLRATFRWRGNPERVALSRRIDCFEAKASRNDASLTVKVLSCSIAFVLSICLPTFAYAKLNIVTTIKPVHSMVSAVVEGTDAELTLLVDGTASEHTYAMKPSQAKALAEADVVVYVSDHLETFLEKPLHNLPKTANKLELATTPRLKLLPIRSGDAWVKHAHDAHDEHAHEDHHDEAKDMHIWLDPNNAKLMVKAIANTLAAKDAGNAARYQENATRYMESIDVAAREIKAELTPFAAKRFIVMHDAYHYFEAAFGLTAAGSVMLRPEEPLAVKHLLEIRKQMEQGAIACIFSEPQYDDKALKNLTKDTAVKQGVLDPLGASIPAGKGQYIALLKAISASFSTCFK
jgi:zinc transport system substrate-binding protein